MTHTLQEKGITLIALVITIVILIILAGVTINLVLGENGILVKAKELGYVTQHNTLYQSNPTTIITAPVTEYGIAYYEFICRNIDQKPGGATHTPASLDYETSIQGAPGTNEWLNIGTPYDVVLDGDFERHLGYLGPKALQNGETRFAARARVSPNTPLVEIEQTSMFNIQIVSQTDFINAAQELGIDNAMELIYSAFEK